MGGQGVKAWREGLLVGPSLILSAWWWWEWRAVSMLLMFSGGQLAGTLPLSAHRCHTGSLPVSSSLISNKADGWALLWSRIAVYGCRAAGRAAQDDTSEGVRLHLRHPRVVYDDNFLAGGSQVSVLTKTKVYYNTFLTLGIKHFEGGEPFSNWH